MFEDQPSIFEVVSRYVNLRKAGKEWVGLSPFRSEKTPSFYVNEEKGTFYDFGDGQGGDVISFIQKIEDLDFKGALSHLGVEELPQRTRENQAAREDAKEIVAWASSVSDQIGEKLREIGQDQRLLQEFTDKELATWQRGVLQRQWTLLVTVDDDLADPVSMVELYENREIIEGLLTL